jgi:hypothetical protein
MPVAGLSPETRKTLVLALACISILAMTAFLWTHRTSSHLRTDVALAACFVGAQESTATARCLEKTLEHLLNALDVPKVLAAIAATSSPAIVQDQCHPIGHIIGEMAYKKYGSVEEALSKCTSTCRSACTHGVIGAGVLAQLGEQYSEEDVAHALAGGIETIGKKYCDAGTPLCHGMGHVAYIATDRNDERARAICDAIAEKPIAREVCYQGLFMERAGTFINLLFPSATGTRPQIRSGDYAYPCTLEPQRSRHACFLFLNAYQEPLFTLDGLETPQQKLDAARALCESLAARDRADCFEGIGTSAALFGFREVSNGTIQELCESLSTLKDRSACVLGILPQFFYQDLRGLFEYCADISEEPRKQLCFDASFLFLSNGRLEAGMPAACATNAACLDQYNRYLRDRSKKPDYRFGLYGA